MTSASDYAAILHLLAPSLAAAAAVGVAGGVAGVFTLLRRDALTALAMPQIAAVGAAIGLRMGWPTLPPTTAAIFIGVVALAASRRGAGAHRLLPSLYVAGLCVSFLVIANSGQHVAEMQNLFTGMDVTVTTGQAMVGVPMLLAAAMVCAALWRRWLLLAQAPAVADAAGVRRGRWEAGFLTLLAIVVALGTSELGAAMVLAMLFLPAAAVLPWARRIPSALASAAALSILFLAGGFVLSVEQSWPLSQSVGAAGFIVMSASHAAAGVKHRLFRSD